MRARRAVAPVVVALFVAACAARPSPSPSPGGDGSPGAATATGRATAAPTATASAPRTPDLPATTPPGTAVWEQLTADAGPRPREAHSWTVDGDGAVAYLFGGRAGDTVYGDLWAFDLAADTWTELEPEGDAPPARFGHNAAWVEDIGLVVFAGQAGTTFYNDLWAYDPAAGAWAALPGQGDAPVPRYGSCAALGPDGRLWVSHGFTQEGNRFSDTRAYDFDAGAWSDETPDGDVPVARCLHGCWWTPERRFALYAGQTTGVTALGDLWALDPGGAWGRMEEPPSGERNLYAFAPWGEDVLVFGGQAADGLFRSDLLRFDAELVGATIDVPSVIPPGRQGAQLVPDVERGRILLFGGLNENGALGDLWTLTPPGT